MNALVTGATGFLGRAVEAELMKYRSGNIDSVTALGSSDTLNDKFEYPSADAVYHLAAFYTPRHQSVEEAMRLVDANVRYTTLVAEQCARYGVREVVYTSSPRQYGPHGPIGLYGATKAAGLQILRSYKEFRTREVLIGDTFGPGDTRGKIIQKIVESVVNGSPLEINKDKYINPIGVEYVAQELVNGNVDNLVGPPLDLESIRSYVEFLVNPPMEMKKDYSAYHWSEAQENLPSDDPFPQGYEKVNTHYGSFYKDLRRYVESYREAYQK